MKNGFLKTIDVLISAHALGTFDFYICIRETERSTGPCIFLTHLPQAPAVSTN